MRMNLTWHDAKVSMLIPLCYWYLEVRKFCLVTKHINTNEPTLSYTKLLLNITSRCMFAEKLIHLIDGLQQWLSHAYVTSVVLRLLSNKSVISSKENMLAKHWYYYKHCSMLNCISKILQPLQTLNDWCAVGVQTLVYMTREHTMYCYMNMQHTA